MRIRTSMVVGVFLAGLCISSSVNAQFGGLASLGGLRNNSSGGNDLGNSLTQINVRFSKAMFEMLTAQAITEDALGDKARADELSSEANSLQGKNDLGTVEKSIKTSEDASASIQTEMGQSMALNDEAKTKLASAVPHYGFGMLNASALPNDYSNWLKSARGAASNPISGAGLAGQIPDVADVTSKLPDLISAWTTTTKGFITFANGNSVDTKDLASKI